MTKFVGRERELKTLNSLLDKRVASFVVIRGRRRIGKSRLIQEFGKSLPCHIFSGLTPTKRTTKQGQIDAFLSQISKAFGLPKLAANNWGDVFWHLGKLVETGRVVIALDEVSWVGSKDPDFLGELKNAWDLHFSKNDQLILIVCGSVSSWITKNILSSTGFVGRISIDMQLEELSTSEVSQFWDKKNNRISPYEKFRVLSVTGGVPRYLEEIDPSVSAEQNIQRLCFNKGGLLFREFDQIFSDLFYSKAPEYASIVKFLSDGPRSLDEIITHTEKSAGFTSQCLQDLVHAGFLTEDVTWNLRTVKTSRLKKYRLSDNYLRFYLRQILPNRDAIKKGVHSPSNWDAIMGLQFENLVLKNAFELLPLMKLDRSDLIQFGPYFQRKTQRQQGCQIDLLIQTRFRTIFVCEVKFSINPIGMDVIHEMREKERRLSVPRGYSTRLALVHVNGVSREASQTLDHIVDFSTLM